MHAARPVTDCVGVPHPHPDLIQLFQGPETLRLDRFTGYTPYQGLYVNSGATLPRKITERLRAPQRQHRAPERQMRNRLALR